MSISYGVCPGKRIVAGVVIEDPELHFSTEGADSRIIPHIAKACQEEVKRVVVIPSNTSVVIYSLVYDQWFCELGILELGVKFVIEDGHRNISIHKLKQQLDGEKCSVSLKAYILIGCNETRKIGSEVPAMA